MTFRALAASLALVTASATASAQYSIVPAQPQEFDSDGKPVEIVLPDGERHKTLPNNDKTHRVSA